MIPERWKRSPKENEEQYLWRIGQAKDSGLLEAEWEDVADFMNMQFRRDESEYRESSAYRKPYQQAKRFYEAGVFNSLSEDSYLNQLREEQNKLKIIKQQISDERIDYQRTVREVARKESFINLVERTISQHIDPFIINTLTPSIDSNEEMIICLSDLHAGIKVRNFWNEYDTTILKERLKSYLSQIKSIQSLHKCKTAHIVLGGDLISGLIHINLRLQNNENVIEQVKVVSTYLGEFIKELVPDFEDIKVHSVSGNHSRLSPNKEDHLKGEELDALVTFCIGIMFKDVDSVEVCEDSYIDDTINSFVTNSGRIFFIVHGDKDTPSTVVSRLTLMTGIKPDGIIMFHRHRNTFEGDAKTKIIQSGSMMGTDDHCVDHRIVGEPEQAVVITSKNRTVKCFYDVGLN